MNYQYSEKLHEGRKGRAFKYQKRGNPRSELVAKEKHVGERELLDRLQKKSGGAER